MRSVAHSLMAMPRQPTARAAKTPPIFFYSSPRDVVSIVSNSGHPVHHSTIVMRGLKGALYWSPGDAERRQAVGKLHARLWYSFQRGDRALVGRLLFRRCLLC